MFNDDHLPNIAPPPRRVPMTLVLRALFGGFLSQFGWLFFAFGMLFVWVFDPGGAILEAIRFSGNVIQVEGEVTASDDTNMSVGDVPVYRTEYAYGLPDGSRLTGRSYETGAWRDAGARVSIEYVERNPSISRIAGMRTTEAGLGVVFIFIFPLVGGALGLVAFFSGRRVVRLMQIGRLAAGTFESIEATSTRVNERPVMKLTFTFEDEYGETHRAIARTHQPGRLEDEPRELVLYDPREPSAASVLDELPCQPRVGPEGVLEPTVFGLPTALYVLLPGVSLLSVVQYLIRLAGS